jgi:beta-lactamase superfamily II metal-dependent hydrolase
MRHTTLVLIALVTVVSAAVASQQQRALDIYFIDVEGGQATLLVSPSGESMLVDTGFPGARDAGRIADVARQAGVKHIDYLVITHYHLDHVGGVAELVARLPVRNFVDHGAPVEKSRAAPEELFQAYADARRKGRHIEAASGLKLPMSGIDVHVVSSGGTLITSPLPNGGAPNALCRDFTPKEDTTPPENARSVGMLVRFGSFRMLNLGDLTWNLERNLVCPNNLIGTVDVYLTTHHGQNASGPGVLVHALEPRVAVLNNGPKKGGSRETFEILRGAPRLEDLWQLHYAVDAGKENNRAEQFIANIDEAADHALAHFIKISARADGGFVVTNSRNRFEKEYRPRR